MTIPIQVSCIFRATIMEFLICKCQGVEVVNTTIVSRVNSLAIMFNFGQYVWLRIQTHRAEDNDNESHFWPHQKAAPLQHYNIIKHHGQGCCGHFYAVC